jgi:acyl-CoA thioesterase FadM
MGRIQFEFVGPAAYGDRILTRLKLADISNSTLTWECTANHLSDSSLVTQGTATRVYAEIQDNGELKAIAIPNRIREMLGAPTLDEASSG